MIAATRVFVDSNILFSASFKNPNRFERFWELAGVDILTSEYSIAEVSRNLRTAEQRARLWGLIYKSHLVPAGDEVVLSAEISLPAKDLPILKAAVAGKANVLVTGDMNHFGSYYGTSISGVLIESPASFAARYFNQLPRGTSKA